MYCYDVTNSFRLRTAVLFHIVHGSPSSLGIANEQTWRGGVTSTVLLQPSPLLKVMDSAGNHIRDRDGLLLTATVTYTTTQPDVLTGELRTTRHTVVGSFSDAEGCYSFDNIAVRSPLGYPVQLKFTYSDTVAALSWTLEQELCPPGEFGVYGAFVCDVCPQHAVCDGTYLLEAQPGYWHGSPMSPYFYECNPGHACVASTKCTEGYTGPVCGACDAGYGKTGASCGRCRSSTTNWLVVCALILALTVIVYFLSVHSLPFSAAEDQEAGLAADTKSNRSHIGVLAKIMISHFQLFALVPYNQVEMPDWLRMTSEGSGQASAFSPNLSFVACVVGSTPAEQLRAALYIVLILVTTFGVVGAGIGFYHHQHFVRKSRRGFERLRAALYKKKKSAFVSRLVDHAAIDAYTKRRYRAAVKRNHEELLEVYGEECRDANRLNEQPPAAPPLWHRIFNITIVSAVVSSFFVYPTIVSACVGLLECTTIQLNYGVSTSVLAADYSVSCGSDAPFGAAVLGALGLGIPLLSVASVWVAAITTCGRDMQVSVLLFSFTTAGYRLWYWEAVALLRKASLVLVTALTPAGQMQLFLSSLLFLAWLVFHLTMRPWHEKVFDKLESASFTTLTLTFGLLAPLTLPSVKNDEVVQTALLSVVAASNVLFVVLMVYRAVPLLRPQSVDIEVVRHHKERADYREGENRIAGLKLQIEQRWLNLQQRHPRLGLLMELELAFHKDLSTSSAGMRNQGLTKHMTFTERVGHFGEPTLAALFDSKVLQALRELNAMLPLEAEQEAEEFNLVRAEEWIHDFDLEDLGGRDYDDDQEGQEDSAHMKSLTSSLVKEDAPVNSLGENTPMAPLIVIEGPIIVDADTTASRSGWLDADIELDLSELSDVVEEVNSILLCDVPLPPLLAEGCLSEDAEYLLEGSIQLGDIPTVLCEEAEDTADAAVEGGGDSEQQQEVYVPLYGAEGRNTTYSKTDDVEEVLLLPPPTIALDSTLRPNTAASLLLDTQEQEQPLQFAFGIDSTPLFTVTDSFYNNPPLSLRTLAEPLLSDPHMLNFDADESEGQEDHSISKKYLQLSGSELGDKSNEARSLGPVVSLSSPSSNRGGFTLHSVPERQFSVTQTRSSTEKDNSKRKQRKNTKSATAAVTVPHVVVQRRMAALHAMQMVFPTMLTANPRGLTEEQAAARLERNLLLLYAAETVLLMAYRNEDHNK
ncbi:MAG: hypothetical protein J0M01_14690 [Dechloromonas sp.]|nr:hypothetical protein [Dechloromonas sp.]